MSRTSVPRKFNYQVRPYRAECLQWRGDNYDAIHALVSGSNGVNSIELFREQYIVVRHEKGVSTLSHGCWAVKGEDEEVRIYTESEFIIKYEVLAQENSGV